MKAGQFRAQEIGMIMSGIKNMSHNDCTERLLHSLEKHIQHCQQFGMQALQCVLTGLRGQQNSRCLPGIFQTLTEKIATLNLQDGDEKRIDFYIAEILNSVNAHWSSFNSDKQKHLLSFVNTLLERFYLNRFLMDKLQRSITLDPIIFDIISPKLMKDNKYDLHGCSYGLAAMITRYTLDQFLNKQTQNIEEKIVIVFGEGRHQLKNAGRMKAVVEEAINQRISPSEDNFRIRWAEPFVVIQGLS